MLIPRFYLGQEYSYGDHDSNPFCALKRRTRLEQLHLARVRCEKGGQQYVSRDARVLFGTVSWSDETLHLWARSSLISHVRLKPSLW